MAVAAFAVVSGEASAGAKRFARLATRGAAAWALQTCPVVVYVTDDQLASFVDAGAPGGRVVHCDGGRSGPGRQWVWWVSGEGKPGGGMWKTVDLFVPSDRTASEVSRYLQDHINVVAYEATELVERLEAQHHEALARLHGELGRGLRRSRVAVRRKRPHPAPAHVGNTATDNTATQDEIAHPPARR